MNLHPIPAFTDNYIWMIDDGQSAWVVDPGDPEPVLAHLQHCGLKLAGILVTHHHFDHVGGLERLATATQCRIVGPDNPRISEIQERLTDGDQVTVLGSAFDVIAVPGHTLDHIAYYSAEQKLLFCGDTLFAGGCGRLFEGTPAMMHASLSKLASLPANTRVCCAHEYTLANLSFARAAEPANIALQEHEQSCLAMRARNEPTLPSSIQVELATNPFLRAESDGIIDTLRAHGRLGEDASPVDVFASLRGWKDEF